MFFRSITLLVVLAGINLYAQSTQPVARTAFKSDSDLVLVPVTVTDRRGGIVSGLPTETFHISDDKVSQRIFSLSEQDVPASIGVILDRSGSMRWTLNDAKAAVRSFLDTANPEDEGFLYSVSSRPEKNTGFTPELDTLLGSVAFSGSRGSTALIDTVYYALDAMRAAHRPRKALLIISDGMDNHSRYSKTELMERVVESDVQIYTIAIYGAPAYAKAIQILEQREGVALLDDLAEKTGGLSFVVRTPEEIGKATAAISRAIRSEYVIAYAPQHCTRDGKWHSIHVKVGEPGLRAYARPGYYAQ
jgi:Ca-activated chloride channel family protein